ncbi:MAG: response regulator, partial [Clostridia bacterium]
MLKVFLVDDEIIIRESIRSCGIWDQGDFTLVGEASDGEIALSMLQDIKPDILITDIKMPFMDGLELSRQVHQTMPWIHIIILSGYDDFTFAKTAINLGVTDYLLKPVDADELLPALQKTAESIRMERAQEQNIHELRQQEIKNRPLLEEQLLKILLEADAGQQEQTNALVQLRKLHIDMTAHFYMVCLLSPRYTQQRLHEHTQVMAALHRLCLNSGGTIHATETSGLCIVLVMGDSEADVEERGYAFAQTALFEVKRTAGIDASISLGQAVDTLKDIPVS